MNTIKIVQHNVAHWRPNRYNINNTYREIDPEIILIQSHGMKEK